MFETALGCVDRRDGARSGLAWLLLLLAGRSGGRVGRRWASLVGLAQFGVLGINAASRQVVQHLEIGADYNIVRQPPAFNGRRW